MTAVHTVVYVFVSCPIQFESGFMSQKIVSEKDTFFLCTVASGCGAGQHNYNFMCCFVCMSHFRENAD